MGKLSKVVAVAAIAGSVAWVGHQVVRHHHHAVALRHEFHEMAQSHHGGDQVHHGGHNQVFEEKDYGRWGGRHGDDVEEFGGHRRRHSDDFGSRREHERQHRRRQSHDETAQKVQRQEKPTGGPAVDVPADPVTDVSVPDVEAAPINFIRFPEENGVENSEVPELEDNTDDIRFPSEETEDIRFPAEEDDESLAATGNQRHHAKRQHEVHFRQFDNEEFTAEEKAEFRRLRKEARRLHRDACRTAGGFVAGAAFVGGVAHLRRLRREKRQAAAAAGGEAGQQCHGSCPSQTA